MPLLAAGESAQMFAQSATLAFDWAAFANVVVETDRLAPYCTIHAYQLSRHGAATVLVIVFATLLATLASLATLVITLVSVISLATVMTLTLTFTFLLVVGLQPFIFTLKPFIISVMVPFIAHIVMAVPFVSSLLLLKEQLSNPRFSYDLAHVFVKGKLIF